MNEELLNILMKSRELFSRKGVGSVTMEKICQETGITKEALYKQIKGKADLVEKILQHERESFNAIFDNYNFDGVNSIDILLIVSKEISKSFEILNPLISTDLKQYYPEIYERQFEKKIDFIFTQIKINLEKGINQGMFRKDLSVQLVARLYISKLIDIHNPEYFPKQEFSFDKLFEVMFESHIRGIATEEGIKHYEKEKKQK